MEYRIGEKFRLGNLRLICVEDRFKRVNKMCEGCIFGSADQCSMLYKYMVGECGGEARTDGKNVKFLIDGIESK